MPYRALLMSIVTVAIALIAVGMWVRAVEPWVAVSQAATQEAAAGVAGIFHDAPRRPRRIR